MSAQSTPDELERTLEFDFVRATENAALNALAWLGRGDKNKADEAACDAILGVFDLMSCRGTVMLGEGIKDGAPGIYMGERLGSWAEHSPHFDIVLDPIDGTTNVASGLPNSISVIAASITEDGRVHAMKHLPSFYAQKLAWGPQTESWLKKNGGQIRLDDPLPKILEQVASALNKPVQRLVACLLDRPRNEPLIHSLRSAGVGVRLIKDGDITAALAPSMPGSGVDLYAGIGGSTEAVLAASALKTLGGEMLVRMWTDDEQERRSLLERLSPGELAFEHRVNDLVAGGSAIFCATGISDSPLLPGITSENGRLITSSILLRAKSRTIRYMRSLHDLDHKIIPLRSQSSNTPSS